MSNALNRSGNTRRLARCLLGVAGLILLLTLAGCADQVDTAIVVQPDGSWAGEARLTFARPATGSLGMDQELEAKVEEQAAGLLGSNGIHYVMNKAQGKDARSVYTFQLEGKALAELAAILGDLTAAAEGLNGPAVLEVRGNVQAGQELVLALPGNPSTGYSWRVDSAAAGGLVQVGEVESRQINEDMGSVARQVIHARAGEAGPATLRLVYRRSWEAVPVPTRQYAVDAPGMDLAAMLAGLSMPEPASYAQVSLAAAPAAGPAGASPDWPVSYNWCTLYGCTPVKNQGGCGSCWAFGTVGVIEQAVKGADGVTNDFSEQYLVSCNHDGYGCDGGNWYAHDYHWNEYYTPETQAGAVPEAQFPYVAYEAPCGGPYSHPYHLASWSFVRPADPYSVPTVDEIKAAIYNHGPIGVSVCAGQAFKDYTGGVFATDESSECGGGSNHAVMLVGWNDAEQSWTLRNSWGPTWGESGYMRIRWGTSVVGYKANYVTYTPASPPPDEFVYLPLVMKRHSGGGGGGCTGLPITEGLEGGVVPPSGWTRIQTNPNQTWKIMTVGLPYAGSYSADVEYDEALGYQNEVLLSPYFTAGGAAVEFASYGSLTWCRDTYDNCDLNVWLVVGDWGGGDDVLVHTADDDWTGEYVWTVSDVSLTPYLPAAGTPIRVAFQYEGTDGAQIGLDAINITCSGGGGSAYEWEFNGEAPGWYSHSGSWYIGADTLYTYGLSGSSSSASHEETFGNFDYEARMIRYGCDTCANRLIFRGTPDPLTSDNHWYHEYKLQYSRDGEFSIFKRTYGGDAIALVGWTYSSAINTGSAWNNLRVVANGSSLTFYINGTQVWSGYDTALSSGRVGVGMYRSTTSTGDQFDVDWAHLYPLALAGPGAPVAEGEQPPQAEGVVPAGGSENEAGVR